MLCLAAAVGIVSIGRPQVRAVTTAALAAILGLTWVTLQLERPRPPWRELAQWVKHHASDHDAVAVVPGTMSPVGRYYDFGSGRLAEMSTVGYDLKWWTALLRRHGGLLRRSDRLFVIGDRDSVLHLAEAAPPQVAASLEDARRIGRLLVVVYQIRMPGPPRKRRPCMADRRPANRDAT